MSCLQTLATLTESGAAAARGWLWPPGGGQEAGKMDAGGAGGTPDGAVERCRRCEELLARWVALTGRPETDLDPDSAEGIEALALRERLELELRWLEAHAPQSPVEAEAKLAVAVVLSAHAGEGDAGYLAFLVQAQAERAGLAGERSPRPARRSARGLFARVGLRR